ncbi:hypothetical protein HOS28_gp64 [Salmonella phage UPF_BP1]|uniref:hypothetical protein n=1 Tax=Salmonella phage UPF_BP1 TaxID=1912492 RepID=UPI000CA1D89C|nr:hypothetical protein HOS28_gp64 [Salmonella phage UPF_BP1]EAR2457372.1 hypothetical protein [Salmonella enterica]ECI2485709.1 hypothetical protein [Salmonella enterica subsp. enterica serovar Enteritidis]AOZ63882.1 hypothetical protein [Salmonella phage UPF_BP1]EAU7157007.1 hypothetical protein [Salmonella enterica]EAX2720388.1 hypothetical protein [Salmonella enterica]
MEGFLRGKCIPGDLKVNETNAEYLVRKFSEAEAKISALSEDQQRAIESIKQADAAVKLAHEKFSALAAENAKLKKFCKDAAFDADYEAELGMERGGFSDALNEIKTPATDAFLAEVRASELDSLAGVAETMLIKFSNQQCSSDMHEVVGWKMVLQQAANRAAQLRKGAAL